MSIRLLYSIILVLTFITFSRCNDKKNTPEQNIKDSSAASIKDKSIPGNFSTQSRLTFDSLLVDAFIDSFPKFEKFRKDLDTFYRQRKFAYAWFDENGMIEPATNLYNRIQHISAEGIPDKLPYKLEFKTVMESDGMLEPSSTTELMLTAQYLVYAKNVWGGLSEKQSLSTDWYLPRRKTSTTELLDSLTANSDIFENTQLYRQYGLLKDQLKKLNDLQIMHPNWNIILTSKNKYELGDSAVAIEQIRQRLYLLADLPFNDSSLVFDDVLRDGVENFQTRHGLVKDGVIGSQFISEINTSLDKRIEQVIVNMERSRWVPVRLSSNYIVVNIPEFKLHVYEHDSLAWNMNVVVGKDQHKTVIFNGEMKYIVFSPYWNIPSSIVKNETLPALRRNPNYLAQHNMEWNNGGIRQKPGPDNSLGLVKFLFPNSHNIYLHDTPAKSLFKENNRAFSHGCIRLAEPKKLAEYLLQNDTSWNEQKITEAMHSGVEKYVTLKQPVPVFIAYFTAWVDNQGKLNFRKDVYDRDQRLAQLILENPAI
ncbi:MAG: L,D-transpeptidase family protein [Ferruginibacter sp.]